MTSIDYQLSDRYTQDEGTVLLTGIGAIARIPVEQLRVDRAAGLRTAAFASGYPGSPLAGLDRQLTAAAALAPDLPIVVHPALNEELAVSAVMGSQLASSRPDARYDGVIGLWYGKAPGLDRSSDALRHAVFAGTAPHGGAVAIVGDDPAAKSSTLPSSSDATFVDLHLPILYPADVGEALELGRHAIALSRASGLWVGLKVVSSVADGSASVPLDPDRIQPVMPTVDGVPYRCRPDGLLLGAHSREIERELRGVRSDLAVAYAEANGLNRVTVECADAWLGIVASGVTYRELTEALSRLGLSERDLAASGIRLLQMRQPVPFDPATIRRFARGLDQLMVVEEMNPTLERMVRDALYNAADRPIVTGKQDDAGRPQFPSDGPLDADRIVEPLRRALQPRLGQRLAPRAPAERPRIALQVSDQHRPFFCSGCPHNHSTRVPAGTLVGAGIGCHTMAMLEPDERLGEIVCITAMGNEGAPWLGMAPFVETAHFTQNLGDGTYAHSGQLAVQAAVAAGADITFKLLFNGHVAMTGGQLPPGQRTVAETVSILLAQGVAKVIVTTDDVARSKADRMPRGVDVWDRSRMIEAQEVLREIPGVTVLVHDQACAAEVRRARSRGRTPAPARRIVINERICEGCGDCAEKSSCLSVHPVDTMFGRKTRIDQASCNLDESCIQGDCPSFVVVRPQRGTRWRRRRQAIAKPRPDRSIRNVPAPIVVARDTHRIRLAGVGGTGVVTAAQVIATAAMADGWQVAGLDQTGLSQKAGAVVSDLCLTRNGTAVLSNHLGAGQADVLVAFDPVAAATEGALSAADRSRTTVVGSVSVIPTASTVLHPERPPVLTDEVLRTVESACGPNPRWLDAAAVAHAHALAPATANMVVLGAGVQLGLLPVSAESLERAITLNGVAIAENIAAVRAGRVWAVEHSTDAARLEDAGEDPDGRDPAAIAPSRWGAALAQAGADPTLVAEVAARAQDLVGYQDEGLASAYVAAVTSTAQAEQAVAPGQWTLTNEVAQQHYRVVAIKDEYEVARLLLDDATSRRAAASVAGPARTAWLLHPPVLRAMGFTRKIEVGSWAAPAMRVLAKGKRIRGGPLDLFSRTTVRRAEHRLAQQYQVAMAEVVVTLDEARHPLALRIASIPEQVRGYEERKLTAMAVAEAELEELMTQWRVHLPAPAPSRVSIHNA